MFLQTLGSLILVVCVSYHLVTASWQVVLLSFVVAGVGYATWIVRKALIRRAKIKALWRRSIEIDEIDEMSRQENADAFYMDTAPRARSSSKTVKTCVAFDGPARSSANVSSAATSNSQTDSGIYPHVVREIKTDPSTRVYKFSMKALANSRVENIQDQAVLV